MRRLIAWLLIPAGTLFFFAITHECFHIIACLLLGGKFSLNLTPHNLALMSVRVESVSHPEVVALAGSMNLLAIVFLLSRVRASNRVWLSFTAFSLTEVIVNIFTDLGDGAYIPLPKLDPVLSSMFFWGRVVAFNFFLYELMLDTDYRIVHSASYQLKLLKHMLN